MGEGVSLQNSYPLGNGNQSVNLRAAKYLIKQEQKSGNSGQDQRMYDGWFTIHLTTDTRQGEHKGLNI